MNTGELLAALYLIRRGGLLMAANLRSPFGEVDLVVRYGGEHLHFVEVKHWSCGADFHPLYSLGRKRRRRYRRSAAWFCSRGPFENDWVHFDLVWVRPGAGVVYYPDVF